MHNRRSGLMIREDQCVSNHHILPSTRTEYYNFGDIFWCQWFAAAVHELARAPSYGVLLTYRLHLL